ncbi:MAG: bifunctional 3-deoxy-7-phosphoheptulonate synthase/chorismate mutase type II [Rikenellaceae bacterium]|nr:bifunctional 3-deoxy-7-phosphoheptulonate synthase/chorismate mutase type II [Rikenellaceae bacterium]MCL2693057.1 bifunctional 3-deoxy-7-phosphoheptulonate synthase/chorismate mutase type II [Rikenellaceae bacterium]
MKTGIEQVRFDGRKPFIIAGPCSAETREQVLETCTALAATGRVDMLRAGVWKPRTKPGTFEGAGARGLAWLTEARGATGLPVAVEVATARHVESALRHGIDAVWIGGRTTVSPFAVQEIADAVRGQRGVAVLIKNPVNPDIDLWSGAVERLLAAGVEQLALVHRGFSYSGVGQPYRNSPMWHLVLEMRARWPHLAMICDPSHIAGRREHLREVAQTAADLRYDGLMIESHVCPSQALSDAEQQITPAALDALLSEIRWRSPDGGDPEFARRLEQFRREIDQIDAELFTLLGRRMQIADMIGEEKRANNVAILQHDRWRDIVERVSLRAAELGLSPAFVKTVLEAIHIESIDRQNRIMNK